MTAAAPIWFAPRAVLPYTRRARPVAGLGALSPAEAAQQAISAERNINPRDAGWLNAQGFAANMPMYAGNYALTSSCGSPTPATLSKVALAGGVTTLALTVSTTAAKMVGAATLSAALGAATVGVGALIGIFTLIHAHHQAAVKREQSMTCSIGPAAANTLAVIDQAVTQGSITPQQGVAALDSFWAQFMSAISCAQSGCYGHSPYCNALCELSIKVHADVLWKKSVYQDMAASAPPAGSAVAAVQQAAASFGLPSWMLWAIGAYVLYEML